MPLSGPDSRPAPARGSACLSLAIVIAGALVALALVFAGTLKGWFTPDDPETVAAASLEGLREQNVLVPFTARYVAVVTSRQEQLGLAAQKTLIMPGTVRYELDLASLGEEDLAWDAESGTLTVTLPPLRLAGPEIDLAGIREASRTGGRRGADAAGAGCGGTGHRKQLHPAVARCGAGCAGEGGLSRPMSA